MIKRICDICQNEIIQNYYTINIYEEADDMRMHTVEGGSRNISNNFKKIFKNENIYCKSCVEQLEEFMENLKSLYRNVSVEQKVFHCMGDGKDYCVKNYCANGVIFKTEIEPLNKEL